MIRLGTQRNISYVQPVRARRREADSGSDPRPQHTRTSLESKYIAKQQTDTQQYHSAFAPLFFFGSRSSPASQSATKRMNAALVLNAPA